MCCLWDGDGQRLAGAIGMWALGAIRSLVPVNKMLTTSGDSQDPTSSDLLTALETPRLRSGQERAVWSDRETV
jgi:hypothetical protein